MADIESLKFDVILQDADFKKRVNDDISLANQLNTSLSNVMKIKGTRTIISAAGVKNAQEMVTYLTQIEQKVRSMPKGQFLVGDADKLNQTLQSVSRQLDKIINKQNQHTGAATKTNNQYYTMARALRTIATLTGGAFSVYGLRRFFSSLIDITGQFEVQKMALRTMLQDVAAADRIFRQLYEFSSDSTYRFSELAKYAKQLSAFNIGKDNLLETTKMLGDVASGVGVSMDRLILAYGHVKSSGFLRGIQLRSFSQNGVPILEELAKMFSEVENRAVSLGEVFDKMMKREIPFEMVEEAFRRMTSEGGKFYKMQEVLSKTLAGQINILKGKWENALYAIGEANDGILKGGVQALKFMVEHLQQIGNALKPVIAGFGAYGAALALASMGNWIYGAARAVKYFVLIAQRTNIATAALRVFGSTTKAVAVGLGALSAAVVIILSIVKATSDANREMAKFRKELDEIHQTAMDSHAIDAEVSKIDSLKKVLNDSNKSLDARRTALNELKRIVPDYHAQLTEEGRLINNNTAAINKYIDALNREAKMKGAEDELAELYKKRRAVEKEISDAQQSAKDAAEMVSVIPRTTSQKLMQNAYNKSAQEKIRVGNQKLAEIDAQIESINKDVAELITFNAENPENYNVKSIIDAIQNYDADIKGLREKAKKGSITSEEKENLETWMKERQEMADLYKTILGVDYDKDNKGGGGKKGSDPFSDAISDLKSKVSLLEKYKSAYEQLESIIGEDEAKEWVSENMGYDLDNFEKDIEDIINKLKGMGDEGKEAADAIEARLGLDKASKAAKEFKAAQKALDEYEKALEKFDKEWDEGDATGSAYKIRKAIIDYKNEELKIDREWLDLQEKAKKANKEITEDDIKQYEARKKANKAKLRETSIGQADDIFKEQLRGYDLTNWNDKTLAQINAIREAIKKVEIPEDILKDLGEDTEAAEALLLAFNQLKQDTLDKTVDPERFKKIAKEAKRIAGYLGKASEKMREFAEATGNSGLADVAELTGMLAQNMQAAADGAEAWGGWWGAIIGGLTDLFDQVTSGLTDAIKASNELAKTVREIRADAFILSQTSLFSDKGIFGENGAKNIRGAVSAMRNLREDMEALGDPKITRAMTLWDKISMGWRLVYNGKHIAPEELMGQGSLTEAMQRYGLNVYDQYGNLDPASIREIIKLFGDEDGVLEKLAKDAEAYAEAMEYVNGAMEDIFGEIASSAADNIIDSWIEAGNAALDYADILDDVAKSYAKMLIQSVIMETALDPITEDLKKSFIEGRYQDAMAMISGAMQAIENAAPMYESILNAFDPYFNKSDSTGSNTLGSGAKSITEETANLLASYINAIRSDVSNLRLMQEKGWENVSQIGAAIPTLNDYLNQVAANTYDTAQNTNSILSELRSVIGAPGTSGSVVRVEAY